MVSQSKIFECLLCHNKWTTPTLTEQENMRCPECGKKKIVLKTDIHEPVMEIGNDIRIKKGTMSLEDKKDKSDNDCER